MDQDKSVDLMALIKGSKDTGSPGLRIAKVNTTEPEAITLIFEGAPLPLGLDIFEIPVSLYPLRKGDKFLVFPILGEGISQRWAAVQKLSGGVTLAIMQSPTSLIISGISKTYTAADLVIPPYFAVGNESSKYTDEDTDITPTSTEHYTHESDEYLKAGNIEPLAADDVVSIAPTWDAESSKIKYVILQRY